MTAQEQALKYEIDRLRSENAVLRRENKELNERNQQLTAALAKKVSKDDKHHRPATVPKASFNY